MASSSQNTCIDAYLLAIPSNYDTTFMDAYLQAIVSNYDELFGQLHLFNVAQKQLLQAIYHDASEDVLRAHLDSTLLSITDGANEEQGDFAELSREERENGKARLSPESPDMLARGRVYEKALGGARHKPRIEKFLVMELEKDANLTEYLSLNLPEGRRLKIARWAARCNFVHMVMALIHYSRDKGDSEFLYRVLTIAFELGYVELVKRLTELEEFDVNRGRLTPLNLAAKLGDLEMVNTFLAFKRNERALSPEGYWALHWAAKMERAEVVNAILRNKAAKMEHAEVVNAILRNKDVNAAVLMSVEKSLIEYRLANGFDTSFGWSDGSDIGPFYKVSLTPLQLASLYGDGRVVKLLKERLDATIEDDTGVQTLQIETKMRRDEILKILTDIPEVEKEAKKLHTESQEHVAAANTILVVAALIGSVTFASGVQPPLGYSPFFGSANLPVGAPSPLGMYPSFASVEGHPWMPAFCIFNSLSFVFAIAALVTGAAAARPPQTQVYIEVVVRNLRWKVASAYMCLYCSVTFVLFTFVIAGLMVFPPIAIYFFTYVGMYVIAVMLTIVASVYFVAYWLPGWQSVKSVRGAFGVALHSYYTYWLILVIISFMVFFVFLWI
jgi:ankyrin repeat protein